MRGPRAGRRYGRYLCLIRTVALPGSTGPKVKAARRPDGKFAVHTNGNTLRAEDRALGCWPLQRVGQVWRQMKGGLGFRPVYHRAARRIRAHVVLTGPACPLERMAEPVCADTWRNIQHDLGSTNLVQRLGPNGTR